MATVRDKLWLWGHLSGSHNGSYGIEGISAISPADAAAQLGLRNLLMIEYGGEPKPPLAPHAAELNALEEVVWSVVGAGRDRVDGLARSVEPVLALAKRFRNVKGAILDDMFCHGDDRCEPRITLQDLRRCRTALHEVPFPLDLWCVLYDYQLEADVAEYLALCDVVTFWTWQSKDLGALDINFATMEMLAPESRRLLGCYMYDYGDSAPMAVDVMRRQCDTALEWLKSGRIDGVIFLSNCVCDLGYEAVDSTRDWIAEHGDEPL